MQKTGPPAAQVNWKQVDELLKIQCSGKEVAAVLDMSYQTLLRCCKRDHGIGFGKYARKKRKAGNATIRRRQWRLAKKGNATMLIWLGKQYLGQTDKPGTLGVETPKGKPFVINSVPLVNRSLDDDIEDT